MMNMTKIYENLYASNPWLHLYAARVSRVRSSTEYEDKDFDTGLQVEQGNLEKVVNDNAVKVSGVEPVLSTESAQKYISSRDYSSRSEATVRELMKAADAYKKKQY